MAKKLTESELLWLRQLRDEWLEQPLRPGQAHQPFAQYLNDHLTIAEAMENYEECEVIHRFIQHLNAKD